MFTAKARYPLQAEIGVRNKASRCELTKLNVVSFCCLMKICNCHCYQMCLLE